MNIKQLKEKIANLPDSMEVFVAERKTEFTYGIVNTAYVQEIEFMEEPFGEPLAQAEVFILDED
jgi:hypothetical protein